MASVKTRDDFCEVALHENHNWAAIEAYDASPEGSVKSELRAMEIPTTRQSFAENCSKEEANLPIDANLLSRFDVICRFCLKEKKQLMDIFGLSDNAIATVESLVDVKITSDDMLPKQICADCHEMLNQCLAFKQQVASTNTALRRCIDQLKQVEIPTKIEVVESSASEITEQRILSAFNELNEGHKLEELIEEEDCTADDDCVEDVNLFSGYIEKPVEDSGDTDSGEPVTNLSRTSVYCEQYGKGFSCNSHSQRHMDSEGKIRINNQSLMCSKSFCQVNALNGHMISNTAPNEDVKELIKAFELTKNNANFVVEQESSVRGSKLPGENQIDSLQCSMNFSKFMQLRLDVKTHYKGKPRESKKPFKCPRCVKSFGNSSTLTVHLRTHTGQNPNKCPLCAKSFRKSCTLEKHVAMHSDEKPYKCLHCSKSFRKSGTLSRHKRTHTSKKPYECPHCSKSFTQNPNLVAHVRTHTGEKPYKCLHCSKAFIRASALADHVRWHTNERPHKCSHCCKSFIRPSDLTVHVRTHTGERPYQCPHCSKSFRKSSTLSDHVRTHTDEKPYQCPDCSKSFRKSGALSRHKHTHTSKKPYKCPHCSKSFNQYLNLVAHDRTHTVNKPFKCSHCSKSFTQSSKLVEHIRTHTGEKPYKCSHCAKSFAIKSNLVVHLRAHTGERPYKCLHCSKAFFRSSTLAVHVRLHTGEKTI